MSSQSFPIVPTAEQLTIARTAQWHQNDEALLTFENLRSWLNAAGLVLFTPRAQQLPAPAPSMVEAVLGTANTAPSLAELDQARSLLARLISEGAAVPLNLMGTPGETPDFVVSSAVVPYIFTLRGDKAWKQPPSTSGATKVSPLALATYNLLAERVMLSAYDLATQLGKEVTETAVLRALNELWSHLRVLPIPQNDGAATLWELTSARFTKQIKAGANAGQPTALSALITLYLGQAMIATEEEIETFLSPLAARSRIRDVIHALLAARELDTIAVAGRIMLYVGGALPSFLAAPVLDADQAGAIIPAEDEIQYQQQGQQQNGEPAEGEAAPRIKKFVAKPRKVGTGFVTKPVRSFADRAKFDTARTPRERRPFDRSAGPTFNKPWEEEKSARLAAIRKPASVPDESAEIIPNEAAAPAPQRKEKRSYTDKKPFSGSEGKRPFGSRPAFGSDRGGSAGKPSFDRGDSRPPHRDFGDSRPPRRDFAEGRPPRREFTPRPEGGASRDFNDSRPPRKTFSKPGGFAPRREGFAGKPSFDRGDSRPPRRDFGDNRPPRRDFGEGRPPRREFNSRPEGSAPRPFGGKPGFSRDRGTVGGSESRTGRTGGPPFRKFDAPRGSRPFNPEAPKRPFNPDRPKRPFDTERPRRSEGSGESSYSPRAGFAGKKPSAKSSGGFEGKPRGGFAGKSGGGFGSKKPFSKEGAGAPGKPAGTFDKFMGNKKPFGKRPPARKWKPEAKGPAE